MTRRDVVAIILLAVVCAAAIFGFPPKNTDDPAPKLVTIVEASR